MKACRLQDVAAADRYSIQEGNPVRCLKKKRREMHSKVILKGGKNSRPLSSLPLYLTLDTNSVQRERCVRVALIKGTRIYTCVSIYNNFHLHTDYRLLLASTNMQVS